MEAKSNFHYSFHSMEVQTHSAGSLWTHQHAAHTPRKGHYHGNNLTRNSPHVLCRSNITSSNLGFLFTDFVKQDGNFPSPKFCLISGKSSQYGSLKGESHAVVIIGLFRKPLLNLSHLHIAFDATSGEIFDDTSAVSSKGGYCHCLQPFLMEVSDLFKYFCCTPMMVSDHRRR